MLDCSARLLALLLSARCASERELARAERAHYGYGCIFVCLALDSVRVWRLCAVFYAIAAVSRRHRVSPASVSRCKMCVVMGMIYSY